MTIAQASKMGGVKSTQPITITILNGVSSGNATVSKIGSKYGLFLNGSHTADGSPPAGPSIYYDENTTVHATLGNNTLSSNMTVKAILVEYY